RVRGPGPVGAGEVLGLCARLWARRMAGRLAERVRQVVVGVDHELGQQLVAAREVAVQRWPGDPELLADRRDRKPGGPGLGELAQRRLLDLVAYLRPVALAHGWRLGRGLCLHGAPPSGLTSSVGQIL